VTDILALARRELLDMVGYEPVEPTHLLAAGLGIPPERILKLDGNENPYGPSPKALAALASLEAAHIYPDPQQQRLRRALAGYTGLGEEHIVAGSGSDELIDLIARLFLAPGDGVIICPPTFGMYAFCARLAGARVLAAPRRHNFSLDLEAIAAQRERGAKLIFVTSPNNPTGNLLTEEELRGLLSLGLIVVVDEAYSEFAGQSFASWVPHHPNLIVLRSFSKWAGLAGLRIGYGLFPAPVAELVMKIKPPYNVNVAAEAAALASLEDLELLMAHVKAIVAERECLGAELAGLGFIIPLPSQANFILCRVRGSEAKLLKERLAREGIFIRHFDQHPIADCLRITVGLPQHTDILVAALRRIGGELGLI